MSPLFFTKTIFSSLIFPSNSLNKCSKTSPHVYTGRHFVLRSCAKPLANLSGEHGDFWSFWARRESNLIEFTQIFTNRSQSNVRLSNSSFNCSTDIRLLIFHEICIRDVPETPAETDSRRFVRVSLCDL